jgi:hypothetical protein
MNPNQNILTQEDLAIAGENERQFSCVMDYYQTKEPKDLLLYLLNMNIQILKEIDFIKAQFPQSLKGGIDPLTIERRALDPSIDRFKPF